MPNQKLVMNGIDGATGEYLLPPLLRSDIAQLALTRFHHPLHHLEDIAQKISPQYQYRCSCDSFDPASLEQSGWGVIFSHDYDPRIQTVLRPLFSLRQQQAKSRYKLFSGINGYQPGESAHQFLQRHGIPFGPFKADQDMPYYLLLIGDLERIPYQFQYELNVHYAVGRIGFDSIEQYAQYAQSMIEAEQNHLTTPRSALFFAPSIVDDPITKANTTHLIEPLATHLTNEYPAWNSTLLTAENATHEHLSHRLNNEAPSLLLAASHSIGFPDGHSNQLRYQGALLCQDWPGYEAWYGPVHDHFHLSGNNIEDHAHIYGMISLLLASFSIGTPATDVFSPQGYMGRKTLAPRGFMAYLPQRLLSHPNGSSLAVLGHMGRTWSHLLSEELIHEYRKQIQHILQHLMDGLPVGAALEPMRVWYATHTQQLGKEIERIGMGKTLDEQEIVALWAAANEARNLCIYGDPAVRLTTGHNPSQVRAITSSLHTSPPPAAVSLRDTLPDPPDLSNEHLSLEILSQTVTEEKAVTPPQTVTEEKAVTPPQTVTEEKTVTPPQTVTEEKAVAKPLVLGDETTEIPPPTEIDPSAMPPSLITSQQDNRVINAWIDNTNNDMPLSLNYIYELKFNVDVPYPYALNQGTVGALLSHSNGQELVEILVVLESEDFEFFGDLQQKLVVPYEGPSKNRVTFSIEAKQEGIATITALFIANDMPFQKMTLTFAIGTLGQSQSPQKLPMTTSTSGLTLKSVFARPQPKRMNDVNLIILNKESDYQFILQNGGVLRANINLSQAQLSKIISRARSILKDIVYTTFQGNMVYMKQDTTIPPLVYAHTLKKLAELGFFLYEQIFYAPGNRADAHDMGTLLRKLSQKRGLTIEIVTENFIFPWALIYDRAPLDLDNIDPEGFWGFRHIIEHMPEFRSSTLISFEPEIMVEDKLTIGYIYNANIDNKAPITVVKDQKDFLSGLPKVDIKEYANSDDLVALLSNAETPEHILYFYCDAVSYMPDENGGVEDSQIILSDGNIRLRDLATKAPASNPLLKMAPLVFFNACQSAELNPYIYNGLVPYLLNRGVRGVIGTEVDTPVLFGAEFAQEFLQRFISGEKSLGELLLDLRRKYLLEKRNILGLLYALYSSGEIIVQRNEETNNE